jgi:hypothetical protein
LNNNIIKILKIGCSLTLGIPKIIDTGVKKPVINTLEIFGKFDNRFQNSYFSF